MESNSIDVSNILTKIKTAENRLLSHFNRTVNEESILYYKDMIILRQETRIAELEKEVIILKGQIENLNNRIYELEHYNREIYLTPSIHFLKFGQIKKDRASLTAKHKEQIHGLKENIDFSQFNVDDIIVISVHLIRATVEKAIAFREYIKEFNAENSKLVLDLSKCVFLDSTFIGVIVSALKSTVRLNGDIRIVLNEDTESIIFNVTRMDKVFKVYDSLNGAVESYKDHIVSQSPHTAIK